MIRVDLTDEERGLFYNVARPVGRYAWL